MVALKVTPLSSRKASSFSSGGVGGHDGASEHEEEVLKTLRPHPHIVEYLNSFTSVDRSSLTVVLGMVRGCNLHELVRGSGGVLLPQAQTRHIFSCVLKGLAHLKEQNILHVDVKPFNVLVSSGHEVKLGDFGNCVVNPESLAHADLMRLLSKQSPAFQCPQVANGLPLIDPYSVDMWAVGIVLYFMVTGEYPFDENSSSLLELMEVIARVEYPPCDDYSGMVKWLLTTEEERMTLEQALKQDFVCGYKGLDDDCSEAQSSVTSTASESSSFNSAASTSAPGLLTITHGTSSSSSRAAKVPYPQRRKLSQSLGSFQTVEEGAVAVPMMTEEWCLPPPLPLSFVDGVENGGLSSDLILPEESSSNWSSKELQSMSSRSSSSGSLTTDAGASRHSRPKCTIL